MASGIFALTAVALYACSSETTGNGSGNEGGAAETGTGEGGGGDGGTDSAPGRCAIFETAGSNAPALSPQVCKDCNVANCCTPITKCYGAAPADGGFDGSNGTKTICQLYGECEGNCAPTDLVCAAQCETNYGTPAANDWHAVGTCSDSNCLAQCN
jgi:hypothetical protein